MEIRNDVDKDLAEMLDNRMVRAAYYARNAMGRLQEAQDELANIGDGLPETVSKRADAMLKKIAELQLEVRKATRDWTEECIRIEDAINAYDKENERRGA